MRLTALKCRGSHMIEFIYDAPRGMRTHRNFESVTAMANNVALFELAKSIIADPAKWHKGTYCTDEDWYHDVHYGRRIKLNAVDDIPAAVCFCGIGALSVAADIIGQGNIPYRAFVATAGVLKPGDYPTISAFAEFNDNPETTHADVMAAFDKAIEAAKTA